MVDLRPTPHSFLKYVSFPPTRKLLRVSSSVTCSYMFECTAVSVTTMLSPCTGDNGAFWQGCGIWVFYGWNVCFSHTLLNFFLFASDFYFAAPLGRQARIGPPWNTIQLKMYGTDLTNQTSEPSFNIKGRDVNRLLCHLLWAILTIGLIMWFREKKVQLD